MSSDRALLESFVAALFDAAGWPDGGDIDGFQFQELAVEYGILIPREVTEPCNKGCEDTVGCHCAEYGDFPQTCYRMADWLRTAVTSDEPRPQDGSTASEPNEVQS